MKTDDKRKFPAYIVPLLAMPLVASIGVLTIPRSKYSTFPSGRYSSSAISHIIRTENEMRDLRRENLEDALDGFGIDYKSFMEVAGFKRTLPVEYDNWAVSVDINDSWFNRGRQAAVDYSEDGLKKVIQIDLSEQDAKMIIERYRK